MRKIFISYSHIDEPWKDRLMTQLQVLSLEGYFEVWEDRQIETGADWYPEIEQAINTASLAILLVSANFLASKFIRSEEIPRLLQRRKEKGMRIFPIILKPCPWQRVEWLSKIQVRPKDGKPLISGTEYEIENTLSNIAMEIERLLQQRPSNPGRPAPVELPPPVSNDEANPGEAISTPENIQRLIRISQRRLQRLREQAALFGISAPPHITIEIEDTEAEIARLREELRQASGGNITTGDIQAEGSAIAIGTGSGAGVRGGVSPTPPNPGGSDDEYNTVVIRRLLKASFTDDDELTIFCADYFPEVEAKFNSGMSRIKKIHLLIQHCQAHLAFDQLLALMREEYPAQYEKYRSQL